MNDFQPTRSQFGNARDAAALAQRIVAGDEEAAQEIITAVMDDPGSIPIMLSSLSSLIGHALGTPQGTPPGIFFDAVIHSLDELEERDA